uniref:Replicase polyprotein 1ab n=3 Tax=unclassified Coronavirinae TaxID=2664420 RepID=A0A2H4MWY7_9NIDO|nr:ORF1ab polyprotein [Rodent coronavirus]
MANQYVLRIADCTNIHYDRLWSLSRAVMDYGSAAACGFTNCRFVAFGLEHLLYGYDDEHWVLILSGNQVLNVELGQFKERPDNIRGYLVISDCTYFEETFDLFLGKSRGGVAPNPIYVDQYLCGPDGTPVRKGLEFKNYFLEGGDTYVEPGKTYVRAWDVERKQGDLTLDGILSIKYLSDKPHKLRDGAIQGVADAVSELNDTNQMVRFIHAFVSCPCGKSAFTVGSWIGFATVCCGKIVKTPICVKFSGEAGSIFALPAGSRGFSANGKRSYAGAEFQFCCELSGVEIWCTTKTFSVGGVCTVGAHLITASDPIYATLFPTNCMLGDDGLSTDYDLCYSIIAKCANDGLSQRIIRGALNASAQLFSNTVDLFMSAKLWFMEHCTPMFASAMKYLWDAVKKLACTTKELKRFWDHLCNAKLYVENHILRFSITTSTKFKNIVGRFLDMLRVSFNILCIDASERYFRCKDVTGTNLKLFKTLLVSWCESAINGAKEAGLTTAKYFTSVTGKLRAVTVRRTEDGGATVLEEVEDKVDPPPSGICRLINDYAFYYGGGYYFPLTASDQIIEGAVFKAAGSPLATDDEQPFVEKPPNVKLEFEFDNDLVMSFLRKSLGTSSKGFHNFDDFEEYMQGRIEKLRQAVVAAEYDFEIPDCYIYSCNGTYEMAHTMRISEFSFDDDPIVEELVAVSEDCDCDDVVDEAGVAAAQEQNDEPVNQEEGSVEVDCASLESTIADDTLYLGRSEFWKNHWNLDCKPMVSKEVEGLKFWFPAFNEWNCTIRTLAVFVGQMFRLAGDDLKWCDLELQKLWETKSQYLWYKLAVAAEPDKVERGRAGSYSGNGMDYNTVFRVALRKLRLSNAKACWVCKCGAQVELDGLDACVGHFSKAQCLCGAIMVARELRVPFELIAPGYAMGPVDIALSRACVVAAIGYMATPHASAVVHVGARPLLIDDDNDVAFDYKPLPYYACAVLNRGYIIENSDVSFEGGAAKYECNISFAKKSFAKLHTKYQHVLLPGMFPCLDGTNGAKLLTDLGLQKLKSDIIGATHKAGSYWCSVSSGTTTYHCLGNPNGFNARDQLRTAISKCPDGSEILFPKVNIRTRDLVLVCASRKLSFVLADYDADDVNVHVAKVPTNFPVTAIDDRGGYKHLRLRDNNCWANAVFVGLQLCNYYTEDDMVWQCALRGANSRFLERLYNANKTFYGSTADAAQALERLLDGDACMTVKLALSCFCGDTTVELRGSVFKFRPINGFFDYGCCNVCETKIQALILHIEGKGFFCYTAIKDSKMLFSGCVGEIVYTGPDQGGHYYIKYGGRYHDGTGSRRSADARSQIAVYNVVGLPEPLFVRQGVRFYKADFTDMLKFRPACVVNAANSNLSHGGGIARAINQATKGELQKLSDRCRNKPMVGSCTAVKCKNFEVLNAVGPRDTDTNVDGLLRSAYDSVRRQGHGLVITPLLSVGIFNVPIATSLAQFLDAFDGFTNFYCYVYTDAEAAALYQYFENLNSLTFEASVSLDDVKPTPITEDVTVTFGTTDTSSIEEVLASRTTTESDDSDEEVVTVLVTEDTVNYTTTSVSTGATFGEQLGVCAIADTDVTTQKPTLENEGCAVVLPPAIDYASYYGFDAASFCAVSHNDYNFGCVIDDGVVALTQDRNNCWLNAVCLSLQMLKPQFKFDGIKKLWDEFCIGEVAGFCHFVYYTSNISLGSKADAEVVLRKLSSFIESDNSVIHMVCTQCVDCKDDLVRTDGAIVTSSLSRGNVVSGKCEHGYCRNVIVQRITGDCILTGSKPCVSDQYITNVGRILYNGDESNGHYTFYDCIRGRLYDGSTFTLQDVASVKAPVSSIVVKKQAAVQKRPPLQEFVSSAPPARPPIDYVKKFEDFSVRFFSVGDYIFGNLTVLFFMMLDVFKTCLTSLRKRDIKILARIPKRSGLVFTKSLLYNSKVAASGVYAKRRWFYMFGIIASAFYICYSLLFTTLRFSRLCKGWTDGYANSTFIKQDYCNGSLVCYECLRGYEELSDFPHTQVKWSFTYNLSEFALFYHVLTFTIMWVFGNKYVKAFLFYFILQCWNGVMCWFDKTEPMWFLNFVKFSSISAHGFSLFCVFKMACFVKHVIFGCNDVRCLSCSRSAKYDRISCDTIVNGVKRSFYVKANGGKSFCEKHQFFCQNCDSYGVGCTFINDHVAKEVANVTRTAVRATGPAYIEVDKVTFEDGFYYLHSGDQFWKYEFDVSSKKFDSETCIKDLSLSADFMVYNDNGTARANAFNASVYFSQLLCKPIKVVNRVLLSSLTIDHGSAMHEAYCKVLHNSFNKDFTRCTDLQNCKSVAGIECRDSTFEAGVKLAHKFDVLLCNDSANNFVTTYAKAGTRVGTADLAVFNRESVREVSHSVLARNKTTIVWSVNVFSKLSGDTQDYIVRTTKAKGLLFLLTFNDHVNTQNLPCTMVNSKSAGLPNPMSLWRFGLARTCCYMILAAICVYGFVWVSSINFKPATFDSVPDYDFRYIEDGAMKFFTKELPCVYNLYKDFPEWHKQRYGSVPTFSSNCPIIVGANDLNTNVVPNVASNVALSGRILVFTYQTLFGHSKLCFNDAYNSNMAKISAGDCERAAIFPSACTALQGVGGRQVYCFTDGLYAGAKLYSDIMPHLRYYSDVNNYVMLPEVIMRGFGFKITRFLEETYCRVGECAKSNAGICVGADEWYVYDKDLGDSYVCSKDFKGLVWAFLSVFNANIGTVLLTGQLTFNAFIACAIVGICYTFVKFKRIFGDMSTLVLMVLAATFINSMSYLFTVNFLFLMLYTCVYFISTRKVYFPMVWDFMYVVAYVFVAPWYVIVGYVLVLLCDCMPSITKLKLSTNLLEGDKFVGSFEHASRGTFVLNAHSCAKLVNEIGQEKLDRYASSYARYRHYSGNPNEADYRAACFAWLAKAIKDYQMSPQDKLYCAPTVSYNSVLQSGFRKIAQPSGLVEPCVVKVTYLNSYLNGVWLGDQVYAPRHVIASDVTKIVDYDTEQNLVRSHNFSISRGNSYLTVKGFRFEGCNVVINVAEVNPFTPEHKFDTLKPGDNFNILACYDGIPSGVYGVTLRHNSTIKGSFVNGTCGSPGYVISNGVIKFCYLHQMELGSGAHVGSDFNGKMYGGYQDQAKIQVEGANKLITENVIAFFYAALLNGERWWCSKDSVCVTNFNSWAADNHYTMLSTTDVFNLVASKTGVSVEQILAAIISYAKGFGHRTILGYASINDEYTITEVMQQMFGVQLQSSRVKRVFEGFTLFFFFVALFWTQFLMYTSVSILQWEVIISVLAGLTCASAITIVFIKHKMVFLYGYVIPATLVVVFSNFLWDYVVSAIIMEHASFMSAYFSFDVQSVFNIFMLSFVLILHLARFYCSGGALVTCLFSCAYTVGLFMYFVKIDVLSAFFMFVSGIQCSWAITWSSYKIAAYAMSYVAPYYIEVFGYTKVLMVLYLCMGYLFCAYYGILYWVNRFTMSNFSMCLGYYDYCVSQAEFKYMVANNLKCPTNPMEALYLNIKLMGIGGPKIIKLSTIQSKLTDLKCTNVVLLSCLSSMNVAVNSKEWSYCVQLHNDINLCDDPEKATEKLLALCSFFLSKQQNFNLDALIDSYFDNKAILHSVASTFASMPSYIAYEKAKMDYEQAKQNGTSDQVVRQLLKAMNIAKSEFDLELSVQRKLNRMADNAAAQMFKDARNVDRKAKVVSSMHGLLVGMLRRLDMSSITELMDLAKDGILPLAVIPAAASNRLIVVTPSIEAFDKIRHDNSICYAGAAWAITAIKDVDGTTVQLAEVCSSNDKTLNWPLHIEAERVVKLQNNEITPGKLLQRVVNTDCGTGKALYCNEQGKGFIYALLADSPDITYIKWDTGLGDDIVIELEKPVKFLVQSPSGPQIKYLYFVKNLNTLRRGAVLGFIGATVRLQAGKPTEYATDCQLLTLCAFAVDPKDAYLTSVRQGHKPLGNCIKMINNGSGNGLAITHRVEANTVQDSYGGASCCLYCRASVEHPGMNGICNLRGKYVQVPTGTTDPVRFVLENEVCSVCSCWLGHGCVCDRSSVQSAIIDQDYLNRVRGSSDAQLEPCSEHHVVRAFDIYNKDVSCITKFPKINCVRFRNTEKHDAYYIVKKCNARVMDYEQSIYNKLVHSNSLAVHSFFPYKEGRSIFGNITRHDLTKYTMMDLCFALRNFDEKNCDVLKEILVLTNCCDDKYFDNPNWYDPVENEHIHVVYYKLGVVVANAMLKCVALCDAMVEKGLIGVLTLDNQDLNGNFYDFGDFVEGPEGYGVPCVTSYYSYMMPIMGMTNCLAQECYMNSDIFGKDFKRYDLLMYDFTEHKEALFKKYFKYWDQVYHPNCIDCVDDMCLLHCANFNTLFATTIPPTAFGPLVRKVFIDGVAVAVTAGYHFKQLGLVWNNDINVNNSKLTFNDLLRFVTDPAILISSSPALIDQRTCCLSVAALSTGVNYQIVKPGYFNKEFYDFLLERGFFNEGSDLTLRHFFFAQNGAAAITDFDYYRYNHTTMLDICQARFVFKVVGKYFECYEGGCIMAKDVIVTNLDKSAGYPLNKFGKARLYYESMTYEEQDALYAMTKRNVLPTMTQLNLKYAISGKARARTVGGVSLLSTMTTRQYHQKCLKSIVATRNATVVIGTTKFYGGWDNMLRTLIDDVENPCLMGWDYPKCDRALPNMIRMASAMILGSKHVSCCSNMDKFYRLSNELAQVLTEVVHSNGGFYFKPGGTTSGDASTAYANSVFNIFQAVSANVNKLLAVDSNVCRNIAVKELQRAIYDNCYRTSSISEDCVDNFYHYLRKHFSMMILSDDGVVCYNKEYADLGYVADISAFKATLYYQNNVFMSTSKCWVEPDINVGPHEFCSQHTLQIIDGDGKYYLPYPDPSRILSAGVFVDDIIKTDGVVLLERYVSLAIDAYPLSKHSNPEYRKVFYTMLEWVKKLSNDLNKGVLDAFAITMLEDTQAKFWSEEFYASLYEKSSVLQSAGLCVVCQSQTVLRCGDCLRRPLLCTKCAYDHVMGTNHKFIMAVTPYVCCHAGCNVNDVTKLYLGGMSFYCVDHRPKLSFALCSNGNVFGLYKAMATGSDEVFDFNRLATTDWSNVDVYKLANTCSNSLKLFAAETVKAKEESVKSSYAIATLKEIVGNREIVLQWEASKTKPPLNRNSVFTGYYINKDAKFQMGEYTFEKSDYGNDSVFYKANTTTKLIPGMIFVLTSHNVAPLRAPVIVNQERYTSICKLYPSFYIDPSYSSLVPHYQLIGRQKITTIQGPPGSGKSHTMVGLGLYYPSARILFTACSHAAVDSLCVKAAKTFAHEKCTRIVPAKARVECYSGFKVNNNGAQYVFSTINALPEISVDLVVVDEVSMCTNYDLSVLNSRVAYRHIVYVGDPQQLPAPRTLITKGALEPADYNVVTRLMCTIGPDVFLNKCYRCPAEVVNSVSSLVYEDKFKPVNPPSNLCFKLLFKGAVHHDSGSCVNRKQLDIVKQFLARNPDWSKAVFISPYNSQNYVAARVLGLQTQTVDSAQGSEYDYVIYTQTSDTAHALNVNRFNVAITRAKKGIFCVMNDANLFNALEFQEITTTDLQSVLSGLFKNCIRKGHDLPPNHARSFLDLDSRFKVTDELAVHIGSSEPTYEHVLSWMGFRFDACPKGYHTMFCTRDFAIRNVRGWLGFDVEGAHVCGDNCGTNVPLQLGFSNGVDFVVQPEASYATQHGILVKNVKARAPPGEQFTHLVPLLRKGQPWAVVRKRVVQMVCDHLKDLSDVVVFVLWAGGLELTTMRYFVKIGPPRNCHCGRVAQCYSSNAAAFSCLRHAVGCDYLYNPYAFDIQQWGYTGSLSSNHHRYCNVHFNEHVASGDAIMTRCLAIYDCFVKDVHWDITYPYITNEQDINAAGRYVERHLMTAFVKLYNPKAIYDVGNPKGIRICDFKGSWYCYDKEPTNNNVVKLEYDYTVHGQFDGLCLFWNCNVDMYPGFSLVCRFDTKHRSPLSLEGVNGGCLYVNKHAFHTPAFDRRALAKLQALPFFFFDDSDCDVVSDAEGSEVDYVPLRSNVCITKCNVGGAVCKKHASLYKTYVQKYNEFTQNGFTLWGPQNFELFNLWQLVSKPILQGLENLSYNLLKKGTFVNMPGELPTAIINDKVFVREGVADNLVFTNNTALPTNVAFELFVKKKLGLTPPLTLLRNLEVTAAYRFVLWDYESDRPFSNFTYECCKYTDVNHPYNLCYDGSMQGSLERFMSCDDGVLFQTQALKGKTAIHLNFGYLNGVPVSTTDVEVDGEIVNKKVDLYIYVRKNGQFVDQFDGFYSQGRTVSIFKPRSTMESDFLELDTDLFINKYGLQDYGFEHVVYGDFSKSTIGGLHLLISQIRLARIGYLKIDDFGGNSDSTVKCCSVTYIENSSKVVCSYVDLLLDDFVTILRSLDLSVVSKVHDVVIDGKPWRWMLWCKDNKVSTFYPQLQSSEWKCGYSMPPLYKIQSMILAPCSLYNYGKSIKLPEGIMFNVVKYTQLCQYLNTTSMCVPHKMRVLHLGAGSDKGVAPGTAVLRNWLPEDALLVDNDLYDYVSDADISYTGDCCSMYLEDKFDLVVSDMYDGKTKQIDGDNVSKDGFFVYINGVITERLALGGTVAIKITEFSWNRKLYELIQRFEYWTVFCTSVNTSSSEGFLIGVNYLGNFCDKPIIDGCTMHANYIFWRNSTVMALSYNSVLDVNKFRLKCKATPVLSLKDGSFTPLVLTLIKNGKLIVRDTGVVVSFSNHLVNNFKK